jgi:hypothetical protein
MYLAIRRKMIDSNKLTNQGTSSLTMQPEILLCNTETRH